MINDSNEELVLPAIIYKVNDCTVDLTHLGSQINAMWKSAGIRLKVSIGSSFYPDWPSSAGASIYGSSYELAPKKIWDNKIKERAPDTALLEGFVGFWKGNPNGYSMRDLGTRSVFFVRDRQEPGTPPIARVASHEVGHLLGLAHYDQPTDHLMASGELGVKLTDHEIDIARATAAWLIEYRNVRW